jgi:phosphoglycerol transferase MdoB-like AlkP superfamily enzyme
MKFIPVYLKKFVLKMGILMLIFTLCRIVFFIYNNNYFPEAGIRPFFVGIWFDLITTCLLFYPLILIELFPNKNRDRKWFKWLTFIFTFLAFFFGIFMNLVDVEYFHHTTTRSNYGLFTMLGYGDDLMNQIPSFLKDYWWILLLLIGLLFGSLWTVTKVNQKVDDSANWKSWQQTIIYFIFIGLFILIGRGGFVSKPIRPTQAAKYTEVTNVQLVLNSAFTVINSWGTVSLEEKHYYSEQQLNKIYPTIHQIQGEGRLEGHNIVIIIMESQSVEYSGYFNESGKSYTPFLDELAQKSLTFPNTYANGKKSLDAVPAILASVPKLMDDEYLLSNYSINKLKALPELMIEEGYSTSFFHGATNGSMNFDSFCDLIGFQHYYGRNEYNNEEHYDGTWGIYDEEFLQWSLGKFNEMKEPFFTTLFTISNHPPYDIPKKYADEFQAESKKLEAVLYADHALREFFKTAKKQPWFNNTLFVLTADHTPGTDNPAYSSDLGKVHIPLLFYHPADTIISGVNKRVVGQIDLMPTILDFIGYDEPFFSFGHSIFGNQDGYTAMLIADKYLFFGEHMDKQYLMTFQNEKVVALCEINNTVLKQIDNEDLSEKFSKKLKAMIQKYNHGMLTNSLTIE